MMPKSRMPRFVVALAMIVALAGAMDLLASATAAAQTGGDTYKTLTRLGGGNRFNPPLKDAAAVQKWAAQKRTQAGLTAVFDKAGLSSLTPTVIEILSKASPDQLKEGDFQPGSTMVWMAFRWAGTRPDIVRNMKWGGKKPFQGFTFVIDDLNQTYTFIVPKPCANISLVSSEPSREKARLDAEKAARDKAEADRLAAERAAAERARLDAERRERERLEAERLALEKAAAERAAAEKAAADKAAAEQAEAERLAAEQKAKVDWFVSPLFGKERRTRDEDVASKTVLTSECAPLFGVKFGAEYKVSPTFKIAPSMGVALNFQTGGHSSLFGEVEANYVMSEKSYVGAGLGLWDINHGSWITPTMSVQFGHQIWTNAKLNKLYFVGEGRILFDNASDIQNNYQFWGGLRYVVR